MRTKQQYVLSALVILAAVMSSTFAVRLYQNSQPTPTEPAQQEPVAQQLVSPQIRNEEQRVTTVFMGDVMLARSIGRAIEQGDNPFKHVQEKIAAYDIRVINLETTVADPTLATKASKPYTFNAPLSSLDVLVDTGIDVSSLANNHTGDFGRAATLDTIEQLEAKGLAHVGAGQNSDEAFKAVLVSRGAMIFAFIAVNDVELVHTKVSDTVAGSAYLDEDKIAESITAARDAGADVVTLLPHWGIEYSPTASARQTEWARSMIDSGADIVIGGHPHVIQPTEQYNDGQIVYSLGNFIFDGMPAEARIAQMIELNVTAQLTYLDDSVAEKVVEIGEVRSIPVQLDSQGYPTLR